MAANDTIVTPTGETVPYGYHKSDTVSKFWRGASFGNLGRLTTFHGFDKYEKEANRYWDKFYKIHQTKFFKDRHWIEHEFQELQKPAAAEATDSSPSATTSMVYALEVGCGVGNTVFPLLATNPNLFFYAVDFAPHAIKLLKAHADYQSTGRCSGHVVDMVNDELPAEIAPHSLDIVMMIFVLSAISPQKFDIAIAKLAKVVKLGGCILFRDYAVGDLAQQRFDDKEERPQKIEENFYVRSDGTRAYYFSEEYLIDLMRRHGFEVRNCKIVDTVIENRKNKTEMHRLWIQGKFERVADASAITDAASSSSMPDQSVGADSTAPAL